MSQQYTMIVCFTNEFSLIFIGIKENTFVDINIYSSFCEDSDIKLSNKMSEKYPKNVFVMKNWK